MNLSELIGRDVHGHDGGKVGLVADARFVLDGPVPGPGSVAGARLLGLVVGPRRASRSLGYERRNVNRPWPLAQLLTRRDRGSFLVLWEDIESVGRHAVVLREGYERRDPQL